MSAESPRNSGTGEPTRPQKPDGRFSGFFKRLFAVPSEPQPVHQTTSRIVQSPPGLEDFAAGLKQGMDNHFASVKQQELDRQAEILRISNIAAAKQAQEEAKQKELDEQERIRREKAIVEANKMLEDFRIRERLEYIRDTVWEGKGQVRSLEPNSSWLGGFEIVHEYPSFTKREETLHPEGCGPANYRWKYVPRTDSTHLRMVAIDNSQISISSYLNSDRFYENTGYTGAWSKNWGWQGDPRGFGYSSSRNEPVVVQINSPESEKLLREAITKVIVDRVKRRLVPAQIEMYAKEEMLRVSPQWGKWNKQFIWKIYHEQHPYVPGSD